MYHILQKHDPYPNMLPCTRGVQGRYKRGTREVPDRYQPEMYHVYIVQERYKEGTREVLERYPLMN